MSLLTRHFTTAIIERFLRFRKQAFITVDMPDGTIASFRAWDLARTSSPALRNAPLAVSTTLDPTLHESRSVIMGGAGAARTFTLPNATGSGGLYHFIVGAVNTSNYLIKTSRGADTFDGSIANGNSSSSGAMRLWSPAATDDTITLNGTTSGGSSIGDWIEVQDIATNQWAVTGVTTGTGVVITPFSDTVA